MTALALKYRPRVFADVAGQRPVAAVLWSMASHRDLAPGLLFHGPSGTGKTTMARILGSALNCEQGPGPGMSWPCGSCASCQAVTAMTSLAVREVDAASYGSAADVRALRERAMYGGGPGEHKLIILDECHAMSAAAYNALLKVLEEPGGALTWLLLTTQPGKVLDTVNGRCLPFEFRRVPPAEISARLRRICDAEDIEADDDLLALFAEKAGGQVRNAVMLLEQAAEVHISAVAQWHKLHGESDFAPSLLAATARGDHAGAYAVLQETLQETGDYSWITSQLVSCLRDVLVLSAGGDIAAAGTALAARQALAAQLTRVRAADAMAVLWDLQTKIRAEDRRAGLDLAVAMLARRLHPEQQPAAVSNGHKPELGEVKAMFGGSR